MDESESPITLRVRNPGLIFHSDMPRFWFCDNPVITHGFNAFNLVIPEYERYFVRSVNHYRKQIKSASLSTQMQGFAGQESMHAKVHEDYFVWLRSKGYRIDGYLGLLGKYALFSERMYSPRFNLAATAAAEHFTATLGAIFLNATNLHKQMEPTMYQFVAWHAAEELEHKSVAYDVLQQVKIGYFVRVVAFTITLLEVFIWINAATYMLAKQDKLSLCRMYQYKRQFRKEFKGLNWIFLKKLLTYYRPGFHPGRAKDEFNVDELLLTARNQ